MSASCYRDSEDNYIHVFRDGDLCVCGQRSQSAMLAAQSFANARASLPAAAGEPDTAEVDADDLTAEEAEQWSLWAAFNPNTAKTSGTVRLLGIVYTQRRQLRRLRSTLDAREQDYANQARSLQMFVDKLKEQEAITDKFAAELAAREQRIGELTRELEIAKMMRRHGTPFDPTGAKNATEINSLRAAVASREERIGELEKENSALRSRL